jgi:ribonuclease Z
LDLFDWKIWPGFYPVKFIHLPEAELAVVLDCSALRVLSSPVRHLIPTIGLRFEFIQEEKILTYSCDTEPCPQVSRLASGADILFHEASGQSVGHSSAAQAGKIASEAGVKQLYLIHYYPDHNPEELRKAARSTYQGKVEIAIDLMNVPVT